MNKSDIVLLKTKSYKSELAEIDYKLQAPEILADLRETRALSKKRKRVFDVVETREKLVEVLKTKEECTRELSASEGSERGLFNELLEELRFDESRLTLKLLSMLLDTTNEEMNELIVEIKTFSENSDFQEKLFKVYSNFASINGFEAERKDNLLFVKGKNARLYFSSATAIHKWIDTKTEICEVRVFNVFKPQKVEIDPADVRVDIFLAHGKGGQNINKVETAVRLVHLPTGIIVTCQDERSQLKNKERAFSRLAEILEQRQADSIKEAEAKQQERLSEEMRKNQRKFFTSNSIFTDSRVEREIELSVALKGNLNEIVEEILLNSID